MSAAKVELKITDNVARITFVNPQKRNAMDYQFCQEFTRAALACEIDPTVKVIVLAAEGDFFSVGGDLADFVENKDRVHAHVLDMATEIHIGVLSLRRAAAPVLAAVNGMAAGGAFSIVCGADMVIAKRSAKFTPAFTKSGLTPDAGGTYFLPRIVGTRKAFDILATNPVLTADQALELGIASRVVDDELFDAEVEALARQLADSVSGAMAGVKALLRSSLSASLDEQLNAEARSISAHCAKPSTLDRLLAFVARSRG